MYVEDFLLVIHKNIPELHQYIGAWHQNFITSVADQIALDRALSLKQSGIIIKLIQQIQHPLVEREIVSAEQIDAILNEPEHRQLPYDGSSKPREARYVGDNLIALRCKLDRALIADIKSLQPPNNRGRVRFNWTHKLWIVAVQSDNLRKFRYVLQQYRFHLDQATIDYFKLCADSINRPSTLRLTEDQSIAVLNVCNNPMLASWVTENAKGLRL